jgi:putative acetyltransferase
VAEAPAIRPAARRDGPAIAALLREAFGGRDEADLVAALAADGDVIASLVADGSGTIAGHVLLSRMEAPFPAAALAPLAVRSDRRRQGIGAALVGAALATARGRGIRGVFVLGDPAYYGRLGFSAEAARPFASPFAGDHFMLARLGGDTPAGAVRHAPAFDRLG